MIAMTEQAIATLRDQLAGLLSQIDATAAAKPRPNVIIPLSEPNAGAVWHAGKGWTVRTINDATDPRFVYVTTPEHVRFDASCDFDAVGSDGARRLAMCLLAAADWADGLAAGVAQLDDYRSNDNPPSKEISR